jgi:hypothetical protein
MGKTLFSPGLRRIDELEEQVYNLRKERDSFYQNWVQADEALLGACEVLAERVDGSDQWVSGESARDHFLSLIKKEWEKKE